MLVITLQVVDLKEFGILDWILVWFSRKNDFGYGVMFMDVTLRNSSDTLLLDGVTLCC